MNESPTSEAATQVRPIVCRAGAAKPLTRVAAPARGRPVQRVAIRFSLMVTAVIWLAGLGHDAIGQTKTKPSFWTGKLEVSVLRCGEKCGLYEIDDKGIVRHEPTAMVSYYTYNVYQNDKGTVRHELIFANTGGVNEQGRGAEIVNYAQGKTLAFDPGVAQAIRVPLVYPNTTSTALQSRELLGFRCSGVRREWVQQRNQFHDERDIWTATDSDFKDPLLEVFYGYNATKQLDLVEVRAIRSFKPSPPLEQSLFELPAGMGVLDFGNP